MDSASMRAGRIALGVALALACLLAVACVAARGAEPPPMPVADAPPSPPAPLPAALTLKLEAPKSVEAGSGYFKVRAVCPVPVSFDVEAQFAEDVTFSAEQLDGNTFLVGVPASAGVVRVTCAANLAAGQPPTLAKVFVEIVAPKKKDPPAPPPPPTPPTPPAPPPAKVGKLFAVFVADQPADRQLAEDPKLLEAIHGRGDERVVLSSTSPAVAAQGLTKFLADAGGAPALILMDPDGSVHKAVRTPSTAAAVNALLDSTHKGE